ncbi:Helix-turn-helix domain of resolvase [Burkholderia sp. WP9]|nr:Helix-turn-helix domain of resolvase [Burkholderia sp. WP9]
MTTPFDELEDGDVLIVTKLDRLGRNAMDVRATVERLEVIGVRVHCLALGGVDLTSPAGKMTMQVINVVAEFERDLLIERTHAGIRRAKAEGKAFGRPLALTETQRAVVVENLNAGIPIAQIAREMKTSRQTIMRVREGRLMASRELDVSVGDPHRDQEDESIKQGQLGPDGVPCALIDWSDLRASRRKEANTPE